MKTDSPPSDFQMADDNIEDDEYHVPLHHKRAFGGAGIKRKWVNFVPASDLSVPEVSERTVNDRSIGDVYLSIVMGKSGSTAPTDAPSGSAQTKFEVDVEHKAHDSLESEDQVTTGSREDTMICPVCKLSVPAASSQSISSPHEAELAHQIHLAHAHPVSALDRCSKGFIYLSSRGWDPDSQVGLGASGREGRLYPVKATMRADNRGVGATAAMMQEAKRKEKTTEKLDAKKVRKLAEEQKKKQQHINDVVYGREDVNKHLGIDL